MCLCKMLNKYVSLSAESLHSNSLSGSDKKGLLGFLKFNRRKSKVEHRLTCAQTYTYSTFVHTYFCLFKPWRCCMFECCMLYSNKHLNPWICWRKLIHVAKYTENETFNWYCSVYVLHCMVFMIIVSLPAMLVLHSHFRLKTSPLRTWTVLMMIVLLTMQTLTLM